LHHTPKRIVPLYSSPGPELDGDARPARSSRFHEIHHADSHARCLGGPSFLRRSGSGRRHNPSDLRSITTIPLCPRHHGRRAAMLSEADIKLGDPVSIWARAPAHLARASSSRSRPGRGTPGRLVGHSRHSRWLQLRQSSDRRRLSTQSRPQPPRGISTNP